MGTTKSKISSSLVKDGDGFGASYPPLPSGCCVTDEGEGEGEGEGDGDEAGAPC